MVTAITLPAQTLIGSAKTLAEHTSALFAVAIGVVHSLCGRGPRQCRAIGCRQAPNVGEVAHSRRRRCGGCWHVHSLLFVVIGIVQPLLRIQVERQHAVVVRPQRLCLLHAARTLVGRVAAQLLCGLPRSVDAPRGSQVIRASKSARP